jgi:hypothetical protein
LRISLATWATSIVLAIKSKRPHALPPPKHDRLFAIRALQFVGDRKERAKPDRAIIVGEFDQSGLLNETTLFDQVARPLAAIHDPLPRIGAALARFNPVCHGLGSLERCRRLLEFRDQTRAIAAERRPPRSLATPPVLLCPWI